MPACAAGKGFLLDGMAGVAAERGPAVVRGALLPAVDLHDRGAEPRVKGGHRGGFER